MRKALALALLVACKPPPGETTSVAKRVELLNRQADADRQTIRELENRVFLLEDKIDTVAVRQQKRAAEPEPQLPVVTRKKDPEPEPAAEPDSGPEVIITLDERGAPVEKSTTRRRAARTLPSLDAPGERLSVGAAVPPLSKVKPRDPDALGAYRTGTDALGRRDHAAAIAAFRRFLERWPDHDYADNAQYWLGEAYYDQADYKAALLEFKKVLQRYPDGNKAPDALLKIGFCHGKLGDEKDARSALAQVVELYPKTDAAKLAEKRLVEEK